MGKSLLIRSIMIGFVSFLVWGGVIMPQAINADLKNTTAQVSETTLVHNGHLTICKLDKEAYHVIRTIKRAVVSAYTSTADQTDSTPWMPASGIDLRLPRKYGVVATNSLPLGTKVEIAGKVYVVEDRMNDKYDGDYFDIWMNAGKKDAFEFGRQVLAVKIIES